MATSTVSIPKKTWTLVSETSISFQIPGNYSAYAVESSTIPTDTSIVKSIIPGRIYTFQKLDGNLYMYSANKNKVAIEPLQ